METNAILGIAIVLTALAILTCLVLWSRRRINHIVSRGPGSAREILREQRGGR